MPQPTTRAGRAAAKANRKPGKDTKGRKRNPGRTPSLDAEAKKVVLRFLQAGMPLDMAARMANVHPATLREWRLKSRNGAKGVYAGFEDEVQVALAEGEAIHVARVAEAGRTNWRASAWLLERMNPARWGLPEIPSDEDAADGATPQTPPPAGDLADL